MSSQDAIPPPPSGAVHAACQRFRTAWEAALTGGPRPAIEDFLTGVADAERPLLRRELSQLDQHFRLRLEMSARAGERRPKLLNPGATWPDRKEGPEELRLAGPPTVGPDGNLTPTVTSGRASVPEPELPAVPGYEVVGVLGRGGMGIVYKAVQRALGRPVALKMILLAKYAGAEERRRFRIEAEAVGRLQHPNIVQVHEVGEHDGLPYFTLELCAGGSLADRLDGTPWGPREAAALTETLARAVDAAHRVGIVHRDLKPDNVLLASDGSPKVTDFGLAKRLDVQGVTQTGAVLGTPSYMAPEQAGLSREIGPPADIYALGAILYELITGRPPFQGDSVLDTLEQVRAQEPVAPRQLRPRLPRDLETICLKCLRKEPERRYASAQALADDLRRFQEDLPIAARPAGAVERLGRWCRRNPLVAILTAAIVVLLIGGAIAGSVGVVRIAAARDLADRKAADEAEATRRAEETARREKDARQAADEANALAQAKARESRDQLVYSHVGSGVRLLEDGDLLGALPWFAEALRLEGNDSNHDGPNRARISMALRRCPRLVLVATHAGPVMHVEAASDIQRVLTVGKDGAACLWSTTTGQQLFPRQHFGDRVRTATVSTDGRYLLTIASNATALGEVAVVHETATGKVVAGPTTHDAEVGSAIFSPDGGRVITASRDGVVRTLDIATQKVSIFSVNAANRFDFAVLNQGGQRVAFAGWKQTQVFDVGSNKSLTTGLPREAWLNGLSLDASGRLLAVCFGQSARVWDVNTSRPLTPPLEHDHQVTQAVFSPDGQSIVTVSDDRTARVWTIPGGKALTPPLVHGKEVWHASFSPDGRWVATASADRSARIWEAVGGRPVGPPLWHGSGVTQARFSADGRYLITASWDQTARVWDLAPLPEVLPQLLPHAALVLATATSMTGDLALTGDADGNARLWDTKTGKELFPAIKHSQAHVEWVALTPDGRLGLSASVDSEDGERASRIARRSEVRIWDKQTGRLRYPPLAFPGPLTQVVLSPDGARFATAGDDRVVQTWDISTGEAMGQAIRQHGAIRDLAFSPDGTKLLIAGWDGGEHARVWDIHVGRSLTGPTRHGGSLENVAFAPDGRHFVTTSRDHMAQLWDASTGNPVHGPLRHSGWVTRGVFSPRGDRVLTAGVDGVAHLWSTATGEDATPPMIHGAAITHVSFDNSGQRLVTTCEDGVVRLFETGTGRPLAPPLRLGVRGKVGAVRPEGSLVTMGRRKGTGRALFCRDGRTLLTAGWDNTARLWNLSPDRCSETDLLGRVELVAGARVHASGGTVPLGATELRRLCQQCRQRFPAELKSDQVGTAAWHRESAVEAEATGAWFAARWHLTRLMATSPRDGALYRRRGRAAMELDCHAEAVTDLTQAVALMPTDADAWSLRGQARLNLDAYPEAEADLSRALALDEGRWQSWYFRGRCRSERQKWSDAIADYSRAIQLAGEHSRAYFRRANALAELGRWTAAVADFTKSDSIDRDSAESLSRLAMAHLAAGDVENYKKTCTALLERFGATDDADTANAVAWTCTLGSSWAKPPAEVLALAERAVAIGPQRSSYLNTLAAVLYRSGRFEPAAERFADAIKAQGKGASAWDCLFLAMVHHRLGHVGEAGTWLARADHWIKKHDAQRIATERGALLSWTDRMELRLLREEARALLADKRK